MSTSKADIRAMREYIMKVDLPPAQQRPRRANTDAPTSGFVNVGAIQVFQDSLPQQQKEDAQNWILFGQLAADKAAEDNGYSRVSDPVRWYNSLIGFLSRVGMRSDGWTRFPAEIDELHENAAETALNLLKQYLTSDDQVLVDRVFHDIRLPQNETALSAFNEAASQESGANFLLLGASVDRFLNLTIHLTCMDFKTEDAVEQENMLFWSWNRDRIHCNYGTDSLTLAKNLADILRPNLLRSIGNAREDNILPILGKCNTPGETRLGAKMMKI